MNSLESTQTTSSNRPFGLITLLTNWAGNNCNRTDVISRWPHVIINYRSCSRNRRNWRDKSALKFPETRNITRCSCFATKNNEFRKTHAVVNRVTNSGRISATCSGSYTAFLASASITNYCSPFHVQQSNNQWLLITITYIYM